MKFSNLRAQWPTLFRVRENISIDGVESPRGVASQGQEDQNNRKASHLATVWSANKGGNSSKKCTLNVLKKKSGPILTSPLGEKAEGFCPKLQVNAEGVLYSTSNIRKREGMSALFLALHLPISICEESAFSAHKEIFYLSRSEKMLWRKQSIDGEFKGQRKQ